MILEHTLNIGSNSSFWEISLAISPDRMGFDFGLIPNSSISFRYASVSSSVS